MKTSNRKETEVSSPSIEGGGIQSQQQTYDDHLPDLIPQNNKRESNTNSGFRTFYNPRQKEGVDLKGNSPKKNGHLMSAVTEQEHVYGSISQYTEKGMRKPFAEIDGQTTEQIESEVMSPIHGASHNGAKVKSAAMPQRHKQHSSPDDMGEPYQSVLNTDQMLVDFNAAVMHLSEGDNKRIHQLQETIKLQKQAFQRKAETYEAVIKNFSILKKLCVKQETEMKSSMHQTTQVEFKLGKLQHDYKQAVFEHKDCKATISKLMGTITQAEKDVADTLSLKCELDEKDLLIQKQRKRINDLEFDNKDMKISYDLIAREVNTFQQEHSSMKERSEKLVEHNVAHVLKISCLEDEKKDLKDKLELIKSKLNSTSDSETELKHQLREALLELSDWKMKYNVTDKMYNQLTDDHQKLEQRQHKLEKKLSWKMMNQNEIFEHFESLKKKYNELKTETTKQIAEFELGEECMQNSFNKLEKEKDDLQFEFNGAMQDHTEYIKEATELREKFTENNAALKEELHQLTKTNDKNEISLNTVHGEAESALVIQKATFEEMILQKDSQIDEMNKQTDSDKENIASLEDQVSQMAEQVDTLQRNYGALDKQKEKADAEITDLKQKIEQWIEKLKVSKEETLEIKKTMNSKVQALMVEERAANQKVTDKLNLTRENLQKQVDTCKNLCDKIDQKEENIKGLKEHIKEDEKEIRQVKFKLNYVEEQLQAIINNKNDRQEEIDSMMDTIAVQNDRLEDYSIHYPDLKRIKDDSNALKEFDIWMSEANTLFKDFKLMIESVFNCNMCQTIAYTGKMLRSCHHFYCKKCLDHRADQGTYETCYQCNRNWNGFESNPQTLQMLEKYELLEGPLVKTMKNYKEKVKLWDGSCNYPGPTKY